MLLHPETLTGLSTSEVLRRYRRPRPRLREAQYLRQHGVLHSLIDISDGLSSDLAHICTESGVSAQLEAAHIPVSEEVRHIARALQVGPLTLALHGGEDFELCFTAPAGAVSRLQQAFAARFQCPLVRVGTVQPGRGVTLRLPDGTQQPLSARGYDHFGPILMAPQRHRMPEADTCPAQPLSRVATPDVITCGYLMIIGRLATVFAECISQWWWYLW